MIAFHQTAQTFYVEEELFYQPSGEGPYVLAQIEKRDLSTPAAERRISERTGVPLRHIRHAGRKDAAATAVQWFSWPADRQKSAWRDASDLSMRQQTRHQNGLGLGHVRANYFRLVLQGNANEALSTDVPFPNFFGRQRFGRVLRTWDTDRIFKPHPKPTREAISVFQAQLFNAFLQNRLETLGRQPAEDDLWTHTNGKRVFACPLDETILARYREGKVMPTGPLFGYRVQLTQAERAFLEARGMTAEHFRAWGKAARGSRRPLFVKPEKVGFTIDHHASHLALSLPAGAYATVYLIHLFQPERLQDPEDTWPDFTQKMVLSP